MQDAGVKPETVVKLKASDKKLREVILALFKSAGAEPAPVVTLEKGTVVVKPGKKK